MYTSHSVRFRLTLICCVRFFAEREWTFELMFQSSKTTVIRRKVCRKRFQCAPLLAHTEWKTLKNIAIHWAHGVRWNGDALKFFSFQFLCLHRNIYVQLCYFFAVSEQHQLFEEFPPLSSLAIFCKFLIFCSFYFLWFSGWSQGVPSPAGR